MQFLIILVIYSNQHPLSPPTPDFLLFRTYRVPTLVNVLLAGFTIMALGVLGCGYVQDFIGSQTFVCL